MARARPAPSTPRGSAQRGPSDAVLIHPCPSRLAAEMQGWTSGQPCPEPSGEPGCPGSVRVQLPAPLAVRAVLVAVGSCTPPHAPPRHLSLLINIGCKRAGSCSLVPSLLVEGWVPNGLAASLEGVGGEGALTCCSAGPCWEERPTPLCPAAPKPQHVWPYPGEGTGVSWPDVRQAGDIRGAEEGGSGAGRTIPRLGWGKGGPGSQVALPVTGGRGRCGLALGAQTQAAQRAHHRPVPKLRGIPGGWSAGSPSPRAPRPAGSRVGAWGKDGSEAACSLLLLPLGSCLALSPGAWMPGCTVP